MAKFIQERVARVPMQGARATGGVVHLTLAGAHSISLSSAQFQAIDPDGSHRDIAIVPASSAPNAWFYIRNTGGAGGNLLVKDGAATVATIPNGIAAFVISDGTNWLAA